jgi:Flp pilus assembly protein TadB
MTSPSNERPVPGAGPGTEPDTADGQRALRLHAGIAAVATGLSLFVSVVFVILASPVLAAVFAVVTLVCVGVLVWALRRRAAGREHAEIGQKEER